MQYEIVPLFFCIMRFMKIKSLILFSLLAVFSTVFAENQIPDTFKNVYDVEKTLCKDSNNINNSIPKWIQQKKIKAGYLYHYSDVSKVNLVKLLGLNTIIIKTWQFYNPKDKLTTVTNLKKWARIAKKEDIHIFVAINWQPYPYMEQTGYRKIVYDDGTEGIGVCPLDMKYWQNHIERITTLIANLSIDPNLQIDGIFLDTEIYGSEKEPEVRRNYYEKKCGFSDTSFSQYLIYTKYEPSKFPLIEKKSRKRWLKNKKLLDEYYIFLRKQVRKQAEDLKRSIHKINPHFIFGMYPHPEKNNWVRYPLAQGLSSEQLPFVVFGIHSYGYRKDKQGHGYTLIPSDIVEQYQNDGINALYCSGYLFDKYKGAQLEKELYETAKAYNGYWIWKLPQLWERNADSERLVDSIANLKRSLSKTNYRIKKEITK